MTNNTSDPRAEGPTAGDAADEHGEPESDASFPIVGVGASAGGLEAFTQLLKALPADTGMAFVLVQHLAPSHPSALAEILSRATRMPVLEVQGEPTVEPNHVYVIPPAQSMVIAGGKLLLLPREGHGVHHPVDQLFRALAEDWGHHAIGVVLSGTATDGTLGLEAIKAEGGITFAQDATAQHEGMPHSAIASGIVDFVLPPDAIARELVRIAQHPLTRPEATARAPGDEPSFTQILQLLHRTCGVDFTHYKLNTLYRRITRRMVIQKMGGLTDYLQLLLQTPTEVGALYQDILIGVTSFFRDPGAFDALKSTVFPRLLKDRSLNDPVRIWTLGCSTGQEAYSLAMAFTEVAEAANSQVRLQIFATDLNATGIDAARAGVYPKDIDQDVSPERLRRFFAKVDDRYRISRAIRDACVFSRHNVMADPPFSRIDMISCRNLLIYLEPVLQQKIMPTLHYALKPAGFLWLGGSETIGTHRDLFEAEDSKQKIYARKSGSGANAGHFPLQHGGAPRTPFTPRVARPTGAMDLHKEAERILIAKFAPPGVLVSADLEIVQYLGDTGAYLTPAPGKASLSLLKMLREGLLVAVRAAVHRAGKGEAPVREEALRVKSNGGYREVAIEVIPVKGSGQNHGGFLIMFEDTGAASGGNQRSDPADHRGSDPPRSPAPDPDNDRLTQELSATREYLQSVIEQQEDANEELQSANEEVQSANEELQSVNEELETSKEEIQSSNEELATVNDELNDRNLELHRLNDDLVNLLGSVQMAIVILGPDLRIRRFTPMAEELLHLIPTDVGRPLVDIKLHLEDLPELEPLLAEVLDTASVKERDVRDKRGHWYSLRLRPYRTLDDKIDGVVVMLVDVDTMTRAHDRVRESEEQYRTLYNSIDEGFCVVEVLFDRSGNPTDYRFLEVNPAFEKQTGMHDAVGKRMRELAPDHEAHWFETFGKVAVTGEPIRFVNEARALENRWFDVFAFRLEGPERRRVGVLFTDITERKRADVALHESERRFREFLGMLAHELRNPLAPIRNALQIMRLTASLGPQSPESEAVLSASEMMERQIGQMVRLVDDLLDVSRISRGKIELRRGRVELASVVSQAVEGAHPVCKSRRQELTVTLPPKPIFLDVDPTRLAQVLGNLLNNACKFTDKGGRISLTAEREGEQAVIRVRDNGIGIAAAEISRIFGMFVQIDTSLERSTSGLGIGLSLVKTLVEMHGGTVEAHSAGVGQGSEFVVRLPISVAMDKPPAPQPTVSKPTPPSARRILVVDDNRDSAETLGLLLDMKGNHTQIAHDGLEAVAAAAAFKPDVVLLDIGLPELNGYEAAQRIRELPGGKTMILIALTGWGQEEDHQKSRDAGFDGHLVKPLDLDALMKMLASLLPSEQAGQRTPALSSATEAG